MSVSQKIKQKNILILDANPYPKSLDSALANQYYKGAKEAGYNVELVSVRDLNFSPNLHAGYNERTELEPDLLKQQELLKWCNHLVVVTPIWWMGFPAIMKGYFDRVFLPGFAFKYHKSKFFGLWPQWDKLLKGRSARIIYTQGGPKWIYWTFLVDGIFRNINYGIIGFVGFRPFRRTYFDRADKASESRGKKWLKKVYMLGRAGK